MNETASAVVVIIALFANDLLFIYIFYIKNSIKTFIENLLVKKLYNNVVEFGNAYFITNYYYVAKE
jgi:hypothetical protein